MCRSDCDEWPSTEARETDMYRSRRVPIQVFSKSMKYSRTSKNRVRKKTDQRL